MSESTSLSSYRWVIELLLLLLLITQSLAWMAPAPLLMEIRSGLSISQSSAGLVISVIALCIGIFSLLGAVVCARLGALRALLLGLWLMAAGEVASGFATSFGLLLACRVLEGVGFGIVIAPPSMLTMEWFGQHEWPYINMVNFAFGYVGMTMVFGFTPVLFGWTHQSWRSVLFYYGVSALGVALLWTLMGREHKSSASVDTTPEEVSSSALADVMKMRNVRLVALGLFGGMWVFNLYTAFLTQYFREYGGMDLGTASRMTQVLPLTGLFAAVGGGIGTGLTGLRKPFTWPIGIATLIGCFGAITMSDPAWIRVSLVLVGIGSAGSLAAISTLMMELPGMSPSRLGAAMGFVWAVGYLGGFFSPFLGGALADSIGLRGVMLGFLVFQLMPIVAMYFLPETGPGKTRYEIEAAEEAAAELAEKDAGAARTVG